MPALVSVDAIGEADGGWLRVELTGSAADDEPRTQMINNDILGAVMRADVPILTFEVEGGRLHDVFLNLTGGTIG